MVSKMILPTDIKYQMVDILDMTGTIVIKAMEPTLGIEVAFNVNGQSFAQMSHDDVDHMIIDHIYQKAKAQEKSKLAMATGEEDNLTRLKRLMVEKSHQALHPAIRNISENK
jgi:hypothetical protein